MTDLVKLLRDEADRTAWLSTCTLSARFRQASDEIERLRELCQHHGKNCNELILRAEKNLIDDMRAWAQSDADPYWKGVQNFLNAYEKDRLK